MSKTDKTRPLFVRLPEAGADPYSSPYSKRTFYNNIPSDFAWTHKERGSSPSMTRWRKRYKSKANRRRAVPLQKMGSNGYGWENISSF